MEGCSKTSSGAASGLPDDALLEILSRVPAKSVCRFKCASKGWCDLTADPAIRKKLMPQAMQGLFVQKAEGNGISFNFIDLTPRSGPLDIYPSFTFLTEQTGIKTFIFLDSCNGLILLGHRHRDQFHRSSDTFVVCNPTTKKWSAVPACGSHEALRHTYLAFDPAVSSHFHLVQFQMPDPDLNMDVESLHVYSSETGTWSENQISEQGEQGQLEGWHHQFKLEARDHHCAFVNGFLHLIVYGPDGKHILVVDIQGKARRIITVPDMASSITSYLGQSQGHLHCVTIELVDEKLSIWVLQDYDTQEWVLKRTVNTLDVFGGETGIMLEYDVVDIHQDSNVLFLLHQFTGELKAYNMDSKEVSALATFQDHEVWTRRDFARYVPYFLESPALTNNVL